MLGMMRELEYDYPQYYCTIELTPHFEGDKTNAVKQLRGNPKAPDGRPP